MRQIPKLSWNRDALIFNVSIPPCYLNGKCNRGSVPLPNKTRMKRNLVLVDFDNCRNERLEKAIGRGAPTLRDYEGVFEDIISAGLNVVQADDDTLAEVQFRFYGGWSNSSDGDETEVCSLLAKIIGSYPKKRTRKFRLLFEIAKSPLFLPAMRFEEIVRIRPWKGDGIKLAPTSPCSTGGKTECASIANLRSWLKGRCPVTGCKHRIEDIASTRGQKLVDTHIVADAIVATSARTWEHIVVISKDDDMVPGLVFFRTNACELSLVRMQYRAKSGRYDQLLTHVGVNIHDV